MRVVVDTNTVVSALLWRGSPYRLFQAVNDDPISLYTSRVLLDEFEDVLSRRKFVNPDDDHVIACALAAKASLIVSGDRDLRDLGTYKGIRILNATDALRLIAQ